MKFTYQYEKHITLQCTVEHDENDKFDPMTGHYTEPGEPYVSCVECNGMDITDIVADHVFPYILKAYENHKNEALTPFFGDIDEQLSKLTIYK